VDLNGADAKAPRTSTSSSLNGVEWWRSQSGALARWEWALIVFVATLIIFLNKGVIRDRGNTWPSLIFHAGTTGLLAVLLVRVARERTRRPSDEARS
jgi:hypothetical protein